MNFFWKFKNGKNMSLKLLLLLQQQQQQQQIIIIIIIIMIIRLIKTISHQKTWIWLTKGNLKREIESLLIAAQNNAIRTNHIKTRIDKAHQNSKCRLCGDREETINHIISNAAI